jgi:uncharacterized membrane protein YkoI
MFQRRLPRRILPLLALLALCGAAVADDDHDEKRERDHHRQDQLRDAVERGEIKPLSDVLRLIKPKLPGEVVGVEVENKSGGWIYELRILDAQGRVFDAHVDAATATITDIEEK